MSKYGAKKVIVTEDGTIFEEALVKKYNLEVMGERFDSFMEGSYYQELLSLMCDGAISKIECHPAFVLQEIPQITYAADFRITYSDGKTAIIDIKGKETSTFSVKHRLFKAKYPDLELHVITKHRGQWVPIAEVKKEKSAKKRALNKLIKQAEEKGRIKHERQPKR